MEILGYKAFNKDHTNRYGKEMKSGQTYHVDGDIKFRTKGHHFCERLEDTLRYFDGFSEISFARVIGSGEINTYSDEYYGYYQLYSCSDLYIDHFLTYDEIWTYIDNLILKYDIYYEGLFRIIQGYKLTDEEIQLILDKLDKIGSKNIYYVKKYHEAIEYYQKDQKDIYTKKIIRE